MVTHLINIYIFLNILNKTNILQVEWVKKKVAGVSLVPQWAAEMLMDPEANDATSPWSLLKRNLIPDTLTSSQETLLIAPSFSCSRSNCNYSPKKQEERDMILAQIFIKPQNLENWAKMKRFATFFPHRGFF